MGHTSITNPFGKEIIKVEIDFCGRKLSLEVGRVGFRTSASVIARYGDARHGDGRQQTDQYGLLPAKH
jgi:hypothetical protein